MTTLNYGPLTGLIGSWYGEQGKDVAPEPDGPEHNSFREAMTFSPACDVDNADQQELVSLQYRQEIHRLSDNKRIHDECGYWIWDEAANCIMHSFSMPRGLAVVAGGSWQGDADSSLVFEVAAGSDHPEWPIAQSAFLLNNATAMSFAQKLTLSGDSLSYSQTTMVDVYGNHFEHTDSNQLRRV